MKTKPKILLIADVPNWIFARHCHTLKRLLSDEFDFTIKTQNETFEEKDYDLIYPLEFTVVKGKIGEPAKYITGIRSYITWTNRDYFTFISYLSSNFQHVHTISRRLYDMFEGFVPNLSYVTHGVDTDFFGPTSQAVKSRSGRLKVGWVGNRDSTAKGFEEFVAPLDCIKGIDVIFCGYDSKNKSIEGVRKFYESIDVYVCSSENEGNNSGLLEAASMERAIITTDNGTVPEYLDDGKSAIIVEREIPNFIRAAIQLRDNPQLRIKLGKQARISVKQGFDWKDRAEDYRTLFQKALKNRSSWQPKSYEFLEQIKKNYRSGRPSDHLIGARFSKMESRIRQLEERNRLATAQMERILRSKRWRYSSRLAETKAALMRPTNQKKTKDK